MTDRKAIAAGDLVQVVRGCTHCGDETNIGHVFIVDEILNVDTPMDCCGTEVMEITAFPSDCGPYAGDGYQLSVLKRIPPLDELESTRTDEPMKEPA